MPDFDRLLASIGIGAAKLTLRLDSAVHPRGSAVTGDLRLDGGATSQQIESIIVRLSEVYSRGKQTVHQVRDEQRITGQLLVAPSMQTHSPFRLSLPDDARLSSASRSDKWVVSAEADILLAANPRAQMDLNVVAHHEVLAVQRAMELLGFVKTGLFLDFAQRESPDTIVTCYRAPISLRDQLGGASLHLRIVSFHLLGRLILNLHQNGVGEHLMALLGGDREEHTFRIPRTELLNPQGGPRRDGAVETINQILSRSVGLSGNENARTLLRPASAPVDRNDLLLRPAAQSMDAHSDRLLRPLDSCADNLTSESDPHSPKS